MIALKNFDWSCTERDLVILVPNFGRGKYIRKLLDSLTSTVVPKDKWLLLVANDCIHEDFSDLESSNVRYFTLERTPFWERGDAYMRNIAIKYSRSKLLAQKDPEVLYTNDFIKGCFDHQDVLYRCGAFTYQASQEVTMQFLDNKCDLDTVINQSNRIPILEDRFVFYHYGYSIPIKYLKDLNGYDEDFHYYGYVDTDMHNRLMKHGVGQFFDRDCNPIHLWHEKPQVKTDPVAIRREAHMKFLYKQKMSEDIVRNKNTNWGEGALDLIPEIS